jgi:hypothetical protein
MKGVLAAAPDSVVVDLSHEIPPFDVSRAGFFLEASRRHFPGGAIFICVVDPGVGGARKIVCLEKFGQTFIAPDNGLLSLALEAPDAAVAHAIEPQRLGQAQTSRTFHGRDIFAPAAVSLAQGKKPSGLGPELDLAALVRLPAATPGRPDDGGPGIAATVLHVDRFGNAITNLPVDALDTLAAWGDLTLTSSPEADAPATLLAVVRSYAALPPRAAGLLAGSQGRLEIAMNQAHAARALGLEPGRALTLSAGTSGIAEA